VQALGLVALSLWGFGATWLAFRALDALVGVRLGEAEERAGADVAWGVLPAPPVEASEDAVVAVSVGGLSPIDAAAE